MNEEERIIEVGVKNVRRPVTWLKDPTRHLLKIKAVNAKDSSADDTQRSQANDPPPDESHDQAHAD